LKPGRKMSTHDRLDVVTLRSTIRFVQGYRYLDRCGDALIRLEKATDEGWIPGEISPQKGNLHNYRLGMRAQFDCECMTVLQTEYISFEHFQDQSCRIYEVLWKTFDIERIITPTLQVILQTGFDELADANKHALGFNLCKPDKALLGLLGGQKSAIGYTLCTEQDTVRDTTAVVERRRLDFQVIRQERQPDFDERIMRRLALLPVGQQKALGHLMSLRRRYPRVSPLAVQFDLENSCEGELLARAFGYSGFLKHSWEWASGVQRALQDLQAERSRR